MNDVLIKALGFEGKAKIYAVCVTNIANEIGDRMNYYPSSLEALGRVLSMGAMMGGCLKREETVTLRIDGEGDACPIIVDADAHGHIRGYVTNPHTHYEFANGTLDVKDTVGRKGTISVIKDLKMKEPFIGFSPIITGEIGEDFAYYYSVSEQTPTAIALGGLVGTDSRAVCSGGFMVQLLPGVTDADAEKIEDAVRKLPPVSEMLSSDLSPMDIVKNIDTNAEILEQVDLEFRCTCSKERFARGVVTLGSNEIRDMIEKEHNAVCTCHFCGIAYEFTDEELEVLYQEAKEKEDKGEKKECCN